MPRSARSPSVVILQTAPTPEELTVSVSTAHAGDQEKVGSIPELTVTSTTSEHSEGGSKTEHPDNGHGQRQQECDRLHHRDPLSLRADRDKEVSIIIWSSVGGRQLTDEHQSRDHRQEPQCLPYRLARHMPS